MSRWNDDLDKERPRDDWNEVPLQQDYDPEREREYQREIEKTEKEENDD